MNSELKAQDNLECGNGIYAAYKLAIEQRNDLLAALVAIQKVNGPDFNGWHGSYDDAIELARKAIKKARGE